MQTIPRVALCWITLSILALLRFYVPYSSQRVTPRTQEAVAVGHNLYLSGEFANPFLSLKTGPTAHVAPAYPYLVALLQTWFGDGARGAFAVSNLESLALVLQIALLPLLAQTAGIGFWAGLISAGFALFGLRPVSVWEAPYLGLLYLIATLVHLRWLRSGSVVAAVLGGLIWGLILLFNPSGLLVLIALAVYACMHQKGFKVLLYFLGIPTIIIAPWVYHQYVTFHRFIFIRDNLGLELAVSYNPLASYRSSERAFAAYHPFVNVQEAEQVVALGEPQYNALKLRLAVAWIKGHPRASLKLLCGRILYFWFPPADRTYPLFRYAIAISTILSVPGILFVWRRNQPAAVALLNFLILFPPVYYVVEYSPRYRFPILWVSFVLAGAGVEAAVRRFLTPELERSVRQ